jgi:CBS domain-containing protein
MTDALHRSDTVGHLMSSVVICVDPHQRVREAAVALRDANVGAVAVVNGGEVTGVLSERDIVHAIANGEDLDRLSVGDAMARGPRYLTLANTIAGAAEMMVHAGVRHLPVVEEGDLVGIVSMRDVVPALLAVTAPQVDEATAPVIEREASHPGG